MVASALRHKDFVGPAGSARDGLFVHDQVVDLDHFVARRIEAG
jgi:hypothetical protein